MRRPELRKKFGFVGVLSVVIGASLMGVAGIEAGAAGNPTISFKVVSSAHGSCSGVLCSGMAGGDVIAVSGAGFSASQLASVLQCNDDPTQPQILFLGNDVPISCSKIVLAGTSKTGTFGPTNYTLVAGTVGPPAGTTPLCYMQGGNPTTTVPIPGCTTSGVGTTDAAKFPCPPTSAQIAAGDACVLAVGDALGERAIGELLFGSEAEPPCPTTTTSGPNGSIPCTKTTPTTSTTTASTSSTSSTSSTTSTTTSSTSSTSSTTSTTPTTSTTTTTTTPTTTTTTPTTSTTSSTTSSTTTTTQAGPSLPIPYELYCPGTPVGNIVLNDATTSATISPANPSSGQQFTITNYQTSVNVPAALVGAAAALGNADLSGQATATLDDTGATPATLASPTLNFDVPIGNTNADGSITLLLPNPAGSVGPFTASGGPISIEQDSSASLTLMVSGNPLSLTCTAYANDSVTPSGITTSSPPGSPLSPVIALADGATTTTTTSTPGGSTTTTAAHGSTTTSPGGGGGGGGGGATSGSGSGGSGSGGSVVSASSGSLAFTGTGSGTKLMALLGALLVLFGLVMLGVVDAPKRLLRSLALIDPGTMRTRVRSALPSIRVPTVPKLQLPKLRRAAVGISEVQAPAPTMRFQQVDTLAPSARIPQAQPPAPPMQPTSPPAQAPPAKTPAPPVQPVQVQPPSPHVRPPVPQVQVPQQPDPAPEVPLPAVHPVVSRATSVPQVQRVPAPPGRGGPTGRTAKQSTVRSAWRGALWLLGR